MYRKFLSLPWCMPQQSTIIIRFADCNTFCRWCTTNTQVNTYTDVHIVQGSKCIPVDQCPCSFHGSYYDAGASVTVGCKSWWVARQNVLVSFQYRDIRYCLQLSSFYDLYITELKQQIGLPEDPIILKHIVTFVIKTMFCESKSLFDVRSSCCLYLTWLA